MGSIAAMDSINRVLERHGGEIQQELLSRAGKLVVGAALENNLYSIQVTWELVDGTTLEGASIDIDTLAEKYPDCEVGY